MKLKKTEFKYKNKFQFLLDIDNIELDSGQRMVLIGNTGSRKYEEKMRFINKHMQ